MVLKYADCSFWSFMFAAFHSLYFLHAAESVSVRRKQNNGGKRIGQEYMSCITFVWLTNRLPVLIVMYLLTDIEHALVTRLIRA